MNSAKQYSKKKDPNPVLKANIFSKWLFLWTRHVFKLGLEKQLDDKGIYENLPKLNSEEITNSFEKQWEKETKRPKPNLFHALSASYGWRILPACFLYSLVKISIDALQPIFLAGLLAYFAGNMNAAVAAATAADKQSAHLYATGIVLCSVVAAFAYNVYIFKILTNGVRLRLACAGLIYKKCLKFNICAHNSGMSAVAISLLSKDLPQFDAAFMQLHNLWRGPIEALVFGYIMWHQIGWPALVGILVILVFTPVQVWAAKAAGRYRKESAKRGDFRSKLMNEIITAIQVIKMYAWENHFCQKIAKIRKGELKFIRGAMKITAAMLCTMMISKLALTISLLTYVYVGDIISASKIFMATSYYSVLNEACLQFWTMAITVWSETMVCIRRINDFLLHDSDIERVNKMEEREITKPTTTIIAPRRMQNAESKEKNLRLSHVWGTWNKFDKSQKCSLHLKDITLSISDNQFIGVIGNVGSGKTTLLNAILGELQLTEGSLQVNGTISYATQDSWVFEGTIRDNIVFVEAYDEQRYKDVLYACELGRDIDLMPFGDATIIGDRGISLSGGQRARVALARAVYRKADIYLFDDPLSAVDSHVGKQLLDKCFLKLLAGKIRILVTHQVHQLKYVNHLVLMEAGAIKRQGTYEELGDLIHQELEEEVSSTELMQKIDMRRTTSFLNVKVTLDEDVEKALEDGINRKENQNMGSVHLRIYAQYFKSLRKMWLITTIFALFAAARFSHGWLDYFISRWAAHEDELLKGVDVDISSEANDERRYAMMIAIILVLGTLALYVMRTFGFYYICNKISMILHNMLFNGIIRACMNFFDANPSGRIMNRFTNDLWKVDITLPQTMLESFSFFADISAVFLIVGITNLWLLIPTVFIMIILFVLRNYYVRSGRNLKRIECITCSPVFHHVNQTFQGLTTIRALNATCQLENEFHNLQSHNTSAVYLSLATNRAFALWIDLICDLYICLVTFSFLALDSNFDSGQVGLAISQSCQLLGMCQWGIRQTAELENNMTSVERIMEYANASSEPALTTDSNIKLDPKWPSTGRIEFKDLRMRYNDSSPYTLKWLNLKIYAKEKIGIVGRTGAGKSSIIQAIFRLAINEGCIQIDGQDIAALGLHDLRKCISIIPQEPVLFTGTLRQNLDPFDEKTDEDMWRALRDVELKSHVEKLAGGLDCLVNDGGTNFSAGQRQLVCLARAILRKNKIIIMDEATANVDPDTDKHIQDTIQTNFSESTVLTIAHRLHTVMQNDRILVMDAGRIVEINHPHILLQNKNSHLYKLVQKSGKTAAEQLTLLAKENYERQNTKL